MNSLGNEGLETEIKESNSEDEESSGEENKSCKSLFHHTSQPIVFIDKMEPLDDLSMSTILNIKKRKKLPEGMNPIIEEELNETNLIGKDLIRILIYKINSTLDQLQKMHNEAHFAEMIVK